MKLKRILALTGALLLVALFVLAIILAVTGAPKNYLMAVIFSMVFIPIIMFAMGLMPRVLKPSELVDLEALQAQGGEGAVDNGGDLCLVEDRELDVYKRQSVLFCRQFSDFIQHIL